MEFRLPEYEPDFFYGSFLANGTLVWFGAHFEPSQCSLLEMNYSVCWSVLFSDGDF
jgi:hypothetical protein